MVVGYIPAILFVSAMGMSVYAYTEEGRKRLVFYSYPVLGAGFVAAFLVALQQVSQGGLSGLMGVGSLLVNFIFGAISMGVVLVVHRIGRHS